MSPGDIMPHIPHWRLIEDSPSGVCQYCHDKGGGIGTVRRTNGEAIKFVQTCPACGKKSEARELLIDDAFGFTTVRRLTEADGCSVILAVRKPC